MEYVHPQMYAEIDKNGDLLGFYEEEHPAMPTAGTIKLTVEQWRRWQAVGRLLRWDGTDLVDAPLPSE